MPTPLLKRVSRDKLPDDLVQARDRSMALRGDATLFEVFGNNPELYRCYSQGLYAQLFHAGSVDQEFKELLRLRLSTLHGCRFCNQGNREDALALGIPQAQVDAIEEFETGPFSDAQKAVLRLAERIALTSPNGTLDQDLYDDLKIHFDDGQILELGMIAGILSGMAKFMFAFDLVEKESTCPFSFSHSE
jgi:alkylhydroperoxidase family enzyme